MNIYDQIKTMTDEMAGDLVAQRRDFHKVTYHLMIQVHTHQVQRM